MPWISKQGGLTRPEMENNADIVINYYRSRGYNDNTIAGLLGNMQAESSVNPGRIEDGGGGGYGLVQWTPMTVLIDHAEKLGLSDWDNGDTQLIVIEGEVVGVSGINEWYSTEAFISNYYNSGATPDMIGKTGADFLFNTMNWSADKLAVQFMASYERPSYDPKVNHYKKRMQYALEWLDYMGGIIPPIPTKKKKNKIPIFLLLKMKGVL